MTTITREQLIKKAKEQIAFCRHTKITGEGRAHVNQCAALFEIALAAMDSKPVAEVVSVFGDSESIGERELKLLVGIQNMPYGTKFYRHAQPAPELKPVGYIFVSDQGAIAYSPTDWGMPGFKLAGQIFGDIDVESQPAPVVLPVQHWEELCRQNPDMSIGDAVIRAAWWNHCRAEILQAGNSPVIPDGLIAAVNRLLDSDGSRGCYSAIQCGDAHDEIERMLAAAPQEVKGE